MANASLNDGTTTLTFVTFKGENAPLGERVEIFKRPGVDGHGFRKIGKSSDPRRFRSLFDVLNAAAVKTQLQAYKAFIGKAVTFTDELGNAWTNVVVVDVMQADAYQSPVIVGGLTENSTHVLYCDWILQFTEE